MATFDSGVSRYIRGVAEVENFFPVDHRGNPDISCRHCDFYILSRYRCGLNGKICDYPDKFLGKDCPLYFPDGTE